MGRICREYRYYNDEPQGYVDYSYEGDSVVMRSIYDQNHSLEKTVIHRFEGSLLSVITEQFPSRASNVTSFHYNEFDSLQLVVYGANDSSMVISYENGKRLRETTLVNELPTHHTDYRYFQDDGLLYRITERNGSDTILSYRNFDYFSSNQTDFYREKRYTAAHQLIGIKRFSFSQNGLISSMEFRLTNGTVVQSKEYIYDSAGNLTEEIGFDYGNTSKSVYLYH